MNSNLGFIFGIHANISRILRKNEGNLKRVSEFIILNKLSSVFPNVYVFSHDSSSKQKILPKNVNHVLLYNQLFYLLFGWLLLLYYVRKHKIGLVYLECSALPMVFMVNKLTSAKVLLNYNYLLHRIYATDKNVSSLKAKFTKNSLMPFLVKHAERLLIRFVDYFIVTSREIDEFIGKRKKLDIKKGILLSKYDPKKVKKHPVYSKVKGPSVVFVSRLTKVKNPLLLIEAYKRAKKQIPDLNLIVCGDGELMQKCREAADRDVHFLGFVNDIPGVLKGADIYALTSNYDASPRSLMEAMAMGKPCISTKVGGVPDYMDETCGILVEPKKPDELAEKIVYLLKNKRKAETLGKRARERMLKHHDLEKNMDKAIDLMLSRIK